MSCIIPIVTVLLHGLNNAALNEWYEVKARHRKGTRQDTEQETGKEQNMVQEKSKTRNRKEGNSTLGQNKTRNRKQDTGKNRKTRYRTILLIMR